MMIAADSVFSGRGAFYPVMPDAEWVLRCVTGGARVVQLRLKDADDDEVKRQIERCLDACARANAQLIINDYWQAAIEVGGDYIHLGQEDLASADVDAIHTAGLRFGVSTHSEDELAIALDARPHYIALGPVYPTLLKKMPWAPQGLERVTRWAEATKLPLIGIGGVTPERAQGVFAAGAQSVAVVTDIVTAEDPDARISEWVRWADRAAEASV